MIWIKNHGISGESDNLRIPLAEHIETMTCHQQDPEGCPAVVVFRDWTGVCIDEDVADVRDGFEAALGSQLRFAVNEPTGHSDYDNKADELDAYYDGKD